MAAPRDTSFQSEAERFVEALENTDEESGTDASQTEVERLQGKLRECQQQVSSTIASPLIKRTGALQSLTNSAAPIKSSAFVTMALAWQVAQLQSDLDAAYRDCFLQTSRDLSDKLACPLELQSISEASFGDLGRTKPEVCIDQCQCSLFWLSCLKETSAPVPVLHVVRLGRPVASSSRIDAMSAFKAMSTCDSVLSPFSACARACQR